MLREFFFLELGFRGASKLAPRFGGCGDLELSTIPRRRLSNQLSIAGFECLAILLQVKRIRLQSVESAVELAYRSQLD